MNMSKRVLTVFCYSLLLTAVALLFSCSASKHYRLLSFFFDGVPSPADTLATPGDTMNVTENLFITEERTLIVSRPDSLKTIYHYPYSESECSYCHVENSPAELTARQPDLCYMCHDDFANNYNYQHGPVSGGYCTMCHHPHSSTNTYLLIRRGNELCLFCHTDDQKGPDDIHEGLEDEECLSCHNPHGGDDNYLIR
jgi:predicted CXXCH cytochrome family protein